MPGPVRVLIAVLALVTASVVGIAVVDGIATSSDGLASDVRDVAVLDGAGTYASIADGKGIDETVVDSRGYAINLTGADDSYVESKGGVEVARDDNWTISAWGYVDKGAGGENMTLLQLEGDLAITYNGSQGNWSAWYYDSGPRNSYRVNVSAPNQTGNFSNVQVTSNGTHLAIYRNNSLGEIKNVTGTSVAQAPTNNSNWDGRVEEVRTFDNNLSTSERQEIVDSPIDPQDDNNRTARIMFDEANSSSQSIFFQTTRLNQFNASFSSGFAGSVMDDNSLSNQLANTVDYEWSSNGPQIKPESGGELDGAPAAYVSYTYETALNSLVEGFGGFIGLAATLPVLLMVGVLVMRVRGMM